MKHVDQMKLNSLVREKLDEKQKKIGENNSSQNTGISRSRLQRLIGQLTPEEIKAIQSLNTDKNKKFDEIKQMAWEIFKKNCFSYLLDSIEVLEDFIDITDCWREAERFYDYAKKKEEEKLNV